MNTKTMLEITTGLGLCSALALFAAPAAAQDTAEEAYSDDVIVVTAQRREEASVDVPISVTTIGADQPSPATSIRQAMFSVSLQVAGAATPSATPSAAGPRMAARPAFFPAI